MNIKKTMTLFISLTILLGCMASHSFKSNDSNLAPSNVPVKKIYIESEKNLVINTVLLNEYVEQMAINLIDNLNPQIVGVKVAVASFVELSSSLTKTSALGNQLSENFIHEIQKLGLQVIDFKTVDIIQVTPSGDFMFSRNMRDLSMKNNINYALSGTLVYGEFGVVVNARIINLNTKVVVSSARKMIPHFVLKSENLS